MMGYGRLYRQHVPEQFSLNPSTSTETPTYTTFTYNADDTRGSITGGEVVTLKDESAMISSTPTRWKQKVTKDILGRTKIVENYTWNGTPVDSASTEYDVLDHATQTRQFARGHS